MKSFLLNATYFSLVFFISLAIAAFALTQRINRYQTIQAPIGVSIQKDEVVLSPQVSGLMVNLYIDERQFVKKGEEVATIDDKPIRAKLVALEGQIENSSAQTEAEVLKTQLDSYTVKAPRDGIIYAIDTTEGSYVNAGSKIAIMYANDNIKLIAQVSEAQYSELKEQPFLNVYSQRFEQSYPVIITGIAKVVTDKDTDEKKYEIQLAFVDQEEGVAFLQGESLELLQQKEKAVAQKPSEVIANIVNGIIRAVSN